MGELIDDWKDYKVTQVVGKVWNPDENEYLAVVGSENIDNPGQGHYTFTVIGKREYFDKIVTEADILVEIPYQLYDQLHRVVNELEKDELERNPNHLIGLEYRKERLAKGKVE